jgi:hypothetical protein
VNQDAYKYEPVILMDKNEPFKIKKVGFFEYSEGGCRSSSFNRVFDFGNYPGVDRVLEYVYYLDYDIQHLYDLEHIWVYLNKEGGIVGTEGSYHGRFLCAYRPDREESNGTAVVNARIQGGSHVVMYSQPGKHAMLASKEIMSIYPELFEACDRLAGIHGLDAPERYLEDIHISEEDNRKVAAYIKDNFSFIPSMEFEGCDIAREDYVELDVLHEMIPEFLKAELDRLGIVYG